MKKTMKKLLLLVAFAAASLVGCDLKDETPTVFRYEQYAYAVTFGANLQPAGLAAVEVTYTDVDGKEITKTVTESWFYPVPAKKGFKMKFSSKFVLAPGKSRPTEGDVVDYTITSGIRGVEKGSLVGLLKGRSYHETLNFPEAYKFFNMDLDQAKVETYEYEIQPILEPKM